MKLAASSPDLKPIEKILRDINHYLDSKTFSSISRLKKIKIKWS